MRFFRLISIFLITLIISIPFFSASVFAKIVGVHAYGKAGYDGYINDNSDFIQYEAIFDKEVMAENIYVTYPDSHRFDTCEYDDDGRYVCSYVTPTKDWEAGKVDYNVIQYDGVLPVFQEEGELVVDGVSPVIKKFEAYQSGEDVNFNYYIEDKACPGCYGCSGVSLIRVMENQNIKHAKSINTTDCAVTGQGNFSIEDLSTRVGETNICIEAYDNSAKQSKLECVPVEIDRNIPVMMRDSFRIFDEDQTLLSYINPYTQKVLIQLNISDNDLDMDNVYADFSDFNHVTPELYNHVKANCRKVTIVNDDDTLSNLGDHYYTCEWGINIDGINGLIKGQVIAVDTMGNMARFNLETTLIIDQKPPLIYDAYTYKIKSYDSNSFVDRPNPNRLVGLKKGPNKLYVELDGIGSGYFKNEVFLDLSVLGGDVRLQTDNCIQIQGKWVCEFNFNINKDDGFTGNIMITGDTADDAGNLLYSNYLINVKVGNTKPEIIKLDITPKCAHSSEILEIQMVVKSNLPIDVVVDASKISTAYDNFIGKCEMEETGNYLCFVDIDKIISEPLKENIEINITDSAGNVLTKFESVEVCEEVTVTEPNFFQVKAQTPNKLDLRMLSYRSVPIYIPLTLKQYGNTNVIEYQAICTGATDAYFYNEDTLNPILVVNKEKESLSDMDKFYLDCTISMIDKKGHKIYTIPEKEQLNISVPVYNLPLGELSERNEAKIAELDQQIKDLEDDIQSWEKWNKYLAILCSTAETMGKINTIIQGLKAVIWGVCCGLESTGLLKPLAVAIWLPTCVGLGYYNSFVEYFVWPTGIWGPSPIGSIVKWGCFFYTCKICDWSALLSVGVNVAQMGMVPTQFTYEGDIIDLYDKFGDWEGIKLNWNIDSGYFNTYTRKYSNFERWNSVPTSAPTPTSDSTNWIFNPYKSIHYAKACLCMPAIIYNMKKERQITCMYKNCLKESLSMGLPTQTCDISYKERQCLYVDSAQFKEHGYSPSMDGAWKAILALIPSIIVGTVYSKVCAPYKIDGGLLTCPESFAKGLGFVCAPMTTYPVECGVVSTAAAMLEILDARKGSLDFSEYSAELNGRDYCSGGVE